MTSSAEMVLQEEETNVQDRERHDDEDEEATADASPSSDAGGVQEEEGPPSASEQPQPLTYALLNVTEQHTWDDMMSRLEAAEGAVYYEASFLEEQQAARPRRNSSSGGAEGVSLLLRQIQGLCQTIQTFPRLAKVHSESTPCLLQRLCLGESSVLSRLCCREDETSNGEVDQEEEALGIVKRLINQNPEALLWTKVLEVQEEEQEEEKEEEGSTGSNVPILKDLVEKFPKIGLFIFERHRSIFDSPYLEDSIASIVSEMVFRFGSAGTILELLSSYSRRPGRLWNYQSQNPIQVVNQRLSKTINDFVFLRATSMNPENHHLSTLDVENLLMAVVLVLILKNEDGVQFLQPSEQDRAVVSLIWCSLGCSSEEERWCEMILEVVTTKILKPRVSTPTFNFHQFACAARLPNFMVCANEQARSSPSMFKFLKTILRMVRVSEYPLEESILKKDVVSHLIPLIDKEIEIEQEYVKLRQVRAILSKVCLGSEQEQEDEEESDDGSLLVVFVQGFDGWAKNRLEGCPLTSQPRIRALRAKMDQLPRRVSGD